MSREQEILAIVKTKMPEKRYIHTLGVRDTAIQLAQQYGEDPNKAMLAAIIHDIAKYADLQWMRDIVKQEQMDERLYPWEHEILHGPVGAYIAKTDFQIDDEDILNAIRHHTTGRPKMSRLEKIIYVADMIEPNRKFEGVEVLRELAFQNIDEAMKACIKHTIAFLVHSEQPIYPLSIECFNDLMREEHE
jgi:predicted HD superfamily hydrolase involved in NAD metabolism